MQAAAAEGHYDVVKELIDRGADINSFAENENFPQGTALQAACESGKVEIVTLLIEQGASPDLGAGEDTCPIMAAAMRGEQTILELLVNAKAEVNVFGGWDNSTVLIKAVINLPVESLQVLLDAGADINLEDPDGDTPLIVAAREGDADCVRFLLDHGADIFHANHDNENALQSAIQYGCDDDCTNVLVERVSEIMAALNKAMQKGNSAVSKVVRSVGVRQGLTYDDWEDHDDRVSEASDEDDRKGSSDDTPQTESFPTSARKIDEAPPALVTAPAPLKPHKDELTHELEAAISAQVSMLQDFGASPPPRPEKVPEKETVEKIPDTIAELPSQRRYSQQVQMEEMLSRYELDPQPAREERPQRPPFVKQPTMQWAQQTDGLTSDPVPSPGQVPIRRKPAPMAFGASYAHSISPAASFVSGGPPSVQSPDPRASFERPAYQNAQSYPGAALYQGGAQPPQTKTFTDHPPPPGPYHAPYDPSTYRPSPGNTPPQNTQPFPDLPLSIPGGWQSPPHVMSPPHAMSQPQPPLPQQQQEWPPQESR